MCSHKPVWTHRNKHKRELQQVFSESFRITRKLWMIVSSVPIVRDTRTTSCMDVFIILSLFGRGWEFFNRKMIKNVVTICKRTLQTSTIPLHTNYSISIYFPSHKRHLTTWKDAYQMKVLKLINNVTFNEMQLY